MTYRILAILALLGSTAIGVGAGVLLSQVSDSGADGQDVDSITGVGSGVDGSDDEPSEARGVEQVVIEGVEGTEGSTMPEPTIESVTTDEGSMQSIRGIKGIDSVALQNLEAVLRMQAPPPEEGGGGGGRAAASLLTRETDEPPPPEVEPDGREELVETDLEGS